MKDDVNQVEAVAHRFRMSEEERYEFGERIHDLKAHGNFGSGRNGDFTFRELEDIARVLLEEIR